MEEWFPIPTLRGYGVRGFTGGHGGHGNDVTNSRHQNHGVTRTGPRGHGGHGGSRGVTGRVTGVPPNCSVSCAVFCASCAVFCASCAVCSPLMATSRTCRAAARSAAGGRTKQAFRQDEGRPELACAVVAALPQGRCAFSCGPTVFAFWDHALLSARIPLVKPFSLCWLAALRGVACFALILRSFSSRFCLRLDFHVTVSVRGCQGSQPGFLVLAFNARTLKSSGVPARRVPAGASA